MNIREKRFLTRKLLELFYVSSYNTVIQKRELTLRNFTAMLFVFTEKRQDREICVYYI